MNKVNTKFSIDLSNQEEYITVRAQQDDNKSRTLEIDLYNNNEPYILSSGLSIKICGHRFDNQPIISDCTYTENTNVITYELTDYDLGCDGLLIARISIFDITTEEILSSFSFNIQVEKNPLNKEVILSSPQFSELIQAINTANALVSSVTSAVSSANNATESATSAASLANDAATNANTAATNANAVSSQVVQINEKLNDLGLSVDTDGYIVQEVEEEE